jgi:transposase
MSQVIIGVDPHKRSATIEIISEREQAVGGGRFATDCDGYKAMLAAGRKHAGRLWAVEGCSGIGRHVAQRLVSDGETVVDVPAKLSARARVFATGKGRKTDPVNARCVAVVALRTPGLRQVAVDDTTVALRLLVDRRDQLDRTRTEVVSRLHHLLLELVPGGAKQFLSAQQARALLNTVRPRDVVGKTRRWLACELIHELVTIDKKIKIANQELTEFVASTGSRLQTLHGIGPSGAARLLGDIGDIARFTSRAHFASWNGTAPIDASSGDQNRHRLSRAGYRRINRALHIRSGPGGRGPTGVLRQPRLTGAADRPSADARAGSWAEQTLHLEADKRLSSRQTSPSPPPMQWTAGCSGRAGAGWSGRSGS